MHLPVAFQTSRAAAVAPIAAPDGAPTLTDVFKGQATEVLARGEAIFWEADPADHIFHLVEGVLRLHRLLPDGRRAIVGFLYSGDMLGVSFQNRYLFTAEAVTDVEARRFPRGAFFARINESPALRSELFTLLCDEMSAAQDQMLLLGRKNTEERVASFLLGVHRKSGVGAEIELPMSRLDIGDYLGLTMETVSRTMTSFCRRGLIAARGRHGVSLRKLGALRKIAGNEDAADPESESPPPSRRAIWPN